jgi:anaerobic selenocysteine-containing dehydrogenase
MDCGDACSLVIDAEKRTVRGNPNHPFTKGFCCKKGTTYFERIDTDERITTPLIKRDGQFVEASWDEAMSLAASRLDAARAVPASILYIHGHGYRGIMAATGAHLFKALGASTTFGSLCDEAGIAASIMDFGELHHNEPEDILNACRVINWGRDITRGSVHQQALIARARKQGTEVLTISPGGNGTDELSDATIRIRPGTDRFLAAAVLKLYLEAGNLNPWVLTRTANWPALRGLIDGLNLNALCAACEVSVGDVETLYDWYADDGNAATLLGWGVQRYVHGGENVRFIDALAMISGNVGIRGGGAYYNISSGRNLGSWEHLVPRAAAGAFSRRLHISRLGRELRRADPPVDFVWIDGHNVVNQAPDGLGMVDGLRRPFVVVMDGYMHDTAMQADVILPPAMMFEREDVLGSYTHNCVNHCGAASIPPGQCRPDYEIIADLGARLADPVHFPDPETCLREGLRKSGISLDELREYGFAKAEHPPIAFEGMVFAHPDGLFRFPETLSPEPERDPAYPLQLLTLMRKDFLQSQIPEADQAGYPTVWIARDNPACAVLEPGRDAYLVTPAGAMRVEVELMKDLHRNTVIMRRGGWMKFGHNPNVLIDPLDTDLGDCTALYSQVCRIENR